jgi:hypothetical protein
MALGSPNGLAVGYFLAQHKHKFGRNKSVEKITVFLPDEGDLPHIIFWIIDAPAGPVPGEVSAERLGEDAEIIDIVAKKKAERHEVTTRVVKDSIDGNNVVREHVFWAKLQYQERACERWINHK